MRDRGEGLEARGTAVLREISGVRQDHDGVRRRWLQDEYFDLFVWTDRSGALIAFQLAYDRNGDEHLLEWERNRGYLHRRVDGSRGSAMGIGGTPLLVAGNRFRKYRVMSEFDMRSPTLDAPLREAVRRRLAAYVPARTRVPAWRRRSRHAHRL